MFALGTAHALSELSDQNPMISGGKAGNGSTEEAVELGSAAGSLATFSITEGSTRCPLFSPSQCTLGNNLPWKVDI